MIKVTDMRRAAARLIARCAGTKSGTWCYVGYTGKIIAVDGKILASLPRERVDVAHGDTIDDVEVRLAMAAAKVRPRIEDAIRNAAPKQRKKKRDPLGMYKSRR